MVQRLNWRSERPVRPFSTSVQTLEMSAASLLWHDYETFGTDPKRDRPAQFAGVRTDEGLNIVGDPLVLYCRPASDMLPQPEACLVTGITPQEAMKRGVTEAEFVHRVHQELARAGTCGVGYNSIRFDDEFTRHALFRNFFDPYAREWQNGNSRWDIIDMVRLTRALRPEGINWPNDENRKPSFRLEDLTAANGIEHGRAHNALSDVYATLAIARLIKHVQPRLYDYVYRLRHKGRVFELLDIARKRAVLHVSARYPTEYGHTALVAPLTRHPVNKNEIVVYDLRYDPAPLLGLDAPAIRRLVFTRTDELPEGVERIALKTIHTNRVPVIAPMSTLDESAATRLGIDIDRSRRHLERLRKSTGLAKKIDEVFGRIPYESPTDPEQNLYGGGFLTDEDRASLVKVRSSPPEKLAELQWSFKDTRLLELLFRYRARNYPKTLSREEAARWEVYRMRRLTESDGGGSITVAEYRDRLKALKQMPGLTDEQLVLLKELDDYGEQLIKPRQLFCDT